MISTFGSNVEFKFEFELELIAITVPLPVLVRPSTSCVDSLL